MPGLAFVPRRLPRPHAECELLAPDPAPARLQARRVPKMNAAPHCRPGTPQPERRGLRSAGAARGPVSPNIDMPDIAKAAHGRRIDGFV